jgi:hypothetical protein
VSVRAWRLREARRVREAETGFGRRAVQAVPFHCICAHMGIISSGKYPFRPFESRSDARDQGSSSICPNLRSLAKPKATSDKS